MSEAVRTKIKKAIAEMTPGSIIFPGNFAELGTISAVNMALSRLNQVGVIKRITKGIYNIPKEDPLLGNLHPAMEDIAEAIAKKEKIKIRPTGVTALNKLGLSTQVPMKVVYLTDGYPRKIKIGKGEITFKRTTPKILAIKGEKTFLAVQAMDTLRKEGVNDQIIDHLAKILKKEDVTQLKEDAALAPAWISRILYQIANKMAHL